MTDASVRGWLVQDLLEDLEAGPVGLYQFIWTLRPACPEWSIEHCCAVARGALDEMLADPSIGLVWMVWPSVTPIGPASSADLHGPIWDDIGDQPYLAIDRS